MVCMSGKFGKAVCRGVKALTCSDGINVVEDVLIARRCRWRLNRSMRMALETALPAARSRWWRDERALTPRGSDKSLEERPP